jgi:GNAT superfamily N-acetyltransferase
MLRGGPSGTPADFSPPGGAYLVGFVEGEPVCGGGIKDLGDRTAEIKRVYVAPALRGRRLGLDLLHALENRARDLGYAAVRLDSWDPGKGLYLAAGYRDIADYNGNPHATFWGEKQL